MTKTVVVSREEFLSMFLALWQWREDLEDGLHEEMKEIKEEYIAAKQNGDEDFSPLAEWLNDIVQDYGYPPLMKY